MFAIVCSGIEHSSALYIHTAYMNTSKLYFSKCTWPQATSELALQVYKFTVKV